MANENTQLQWTEEQWSRVRQVITEESSRARVAGSFLPLYGPLPPNTDFVRKEELGLWEKDDSPPIHSHPPHTAIMTIDDVTTLPLATLQIRVVLRGGQVADPELSSALLMFRRAANVLARLEDAMIFNGQAGAGQGPRGNPVEPKIWNVLGGQEGRGLYDISTKSGGATLTVSGARQDSLGNELVGKVSEAIGSLEGLGHLGPFACVLGQDYFTAVQTPNDSSLVLPQDRIIPFLGGGPLLRCSVLESNCGVVIGLAGSPIDLVVATDVSVNFLQVTLDPKFVFRVYEKIVLRIKEPSAIVALRSAAGSSPASSKK